MSERDDLNRFFDEAKGLERLCVLLFYLNFGIS
jgi:hypothetical protein